MKALILILLTAIVAAGQQRHNVIDASLPPPNSPGTVTLSLSEYNRLVDLVMRKAKTPDKAPLPVILSHAVFKLRVEKQTLVGTVDIDGTLLESGPVKTPLTTGLTILEAKQAGTALPLMQSRSASAGGLGFIEGLQRVVCLYEHRSTVWEERNVRHGSAAPGFAR